MGPATPGNPRVAVAVRHDRGILRRIVAGEVAMTSLQFAWAVAGALFALDLAFWGVAALNRLFGKTAR